MLSFIMLMCLMAGNMVHAQIHQLSMKSHNKKIEIITDNADYVWMHCATVLLKKKSVALLKLEKVTCSFENTSIVICDGSLYSKQRGKPCLYTERECLADGQSLDRSVEFNLKPAQKINGLNEYCIVLTINKDDIEKLKSATLKLQFFTSDNGDVQLVESVVKQKE